MERKEIAKLLVYELIRGTEQKIWDGCPHVKLTAPITGKGFLHICIGTEDVSG